mgnify:CR=1 FL=1
MTKPKLKILWGITSSGDMIGDIVDLMIEVKKWKLWDIEVMLSRSTAFVLQYYGVLEKLTKNFSIIHREKGPNGPFLGGPIQKGKYEFLIIAPVTGNTMAKIAHGIADALIPNCVALGLKARIPSYLFPTDQAGVGEETILRDGSKLRLYPRKIDLENVDRVRKMENTIVFTSFDEMNSFFSKKKRNAEAK